MILFIRHFISYVFKAKTRQGLILLVVLGLTLCSLALVVLQGIMSGLQTSMISKYQRIEGKYYLNSINNDEEGSNALKKIHAILKSRNIPSYQSLVLEMLLKQNEYMAPVLITAYDTNEKWPGFLNDLDTSGIILGADLASKLKAGPMTQLTLYSPAHAVAMLGDIPKFSREPISDFVLTGYEDIDSLRGWVRLSLVQNLIRENKINSLIFYDDKYLPEIKSLLKNFTSQVKLMTWEEGHAELIWAFNLETTVMVLLFTMMAILVSITIISSCSLFLSKIHLEIFVFWLLGESSKKLKKSLFLTFQVIIFTSVIAGIAMGLLLLVYLDLKNPLIMPDVFLERSVPVKIELVNITLAFLIPYIVASSFTWWSLSDFFRNQTSFSLLIKRVE